jgi:dihydropteroate synthase
MRRVVPVIGVLAAAGARVSVDTSKAEVAAAAIDAGAAIVNDVTGLGDPEMAPLCAERGVELIVMHMQGTPRTMQEDPTYDDVVGDVRAFLAGRIEAAVGAGVDRSKIWVDPGIGFGKTLDHNLELIRRLGELRELGCPILLGASRKSFLGKLTGSPVTERLGGSIAAAVLGVQAGADAVRVHDVAATRDALMLVDAIVAGAPT